MKTLVEIERMVGGLPQASIAVNTHLKARGGGARCFGGFQRVSTGFNGLFDGSCMTATGYFMQLFGGY